MKILGESKLVDATPYVHLGYLAATSYHPDGRMMDLAGAMTLWGIGLTAAATVPLLFRRVRRHAFAIAVCAVLLAGGIGLLIARSRVVDLANARGRIRADHPKIFTLNRLDSLLTKLEAHRESGRPFPTDPDAFRREFGEPLEDGWANPLRLEQRSVDGKPQHILISAGPDEKFDTPDDLRTDRWPTAADE